MADYDYSTILSGILGAQNAAAADNPYAQLAGFGQSLPGLVLKNAPNFSVGDNIVAGIMAGLTGGLTHDLSQGYLDTQKGLANDAIKQVLSGGGNSSLFTQPEGMSDSVWSSIQGINEAHQIADAQNLKELAQKQVISNPVQAALSPALGGPNLFHLAGLQDDSSMQLPGFSFDPNAQAAAAGDSNVGAPNSDGSPTFVDMVKQYGDIPTARAKIEQQFKDKKANQTSIDRIAEAKAGIQAINDAQDRLRNIYGAQTLPDSLEAPVAAISSYFGGTGAGQYEKTLPTLESEISGAISRSSRGGQNVTLDALRKSLDLTSTSGPGAAIDALESQKQQLVNIIQNVVSTGADAGQTNLNDLLGSVLDAASSNKGLPAVGPAAAAPALDQKAQALAILKARGVIP